MRQVMSTALVALVVGAIAGATMGAMAQAEPASEQAVTPAAARGNADRVDGKHAVTFTNKRGQRAGKLVATNRGGWLPSNIVQPLWHLIKNKPAGFADGVDDVGVVGMRAVRVKSEDLPATGGGASVLRTLACPAGSVAIGGGAEMDDAGINIVSSYPTAGLAGWSVRYRKDTALSGIWRIYAVCLYVDPAGAITTANRRQ